MTVPFLQYKFKIEQF